MSDIDPRPMEAHLLKICEEVIKLKYDESATNTKHLKNICKFLFEEMGENNEVFKEIFQSVVPAGSYPDNLKISEPDEYDLLIVLKFPSPRVEPSRPGYVTINIKDARRKGWNIGNVDYNMFVDEEGYLIQNNVLNWIRGVVRSTLLEHNNVIETGEDSYEVIQSSNGPAVTLDVSIQHSEYNLFSIDFVGCLSFHSDECWMSDVRRSTGEWNAIPKPIKLNETLTAQYLTYAKEKPEQMETSEREKITTSTAVDNKTRKEAIALKSQQKDSGKVKRPPSYFRYKNRKPKVSESVVTLSVDSPNTNARSGTFHRISKKAKMDADVKSKESTDGEKDDRPIINTRKSRWEKLTVQKNGKKSDNRFRYRKAGLKSAKVEANVNMKEYTVGKTVDSLTYNIQKSTVNSDNEIRCRKSGPWVTRKKKVKVEDKVEENHNVRLPKWGKPSVNVKEKNLEIGGAKSKNRKVDGTKTATVTKKKITDATEVNKVVIPNPQKNREWICSYAEIERELLKGTQTMKPLIRIFKKIRDNKQLTNLKSYFIKTIFLHHNSNNENEYWQQSLAVLFMEMFDVVLKHLSEHRLDSFWHRDFNLFHCFRPEQITAIYDNWLKMKKDLISNLEDDNPEFIYELVCTKEERILLGQFEEID